MVPSCRPPRRSAPTPESYSVVLRFVVALEAEARPIIERYRLSRDGVPLAFSIYRRDEVALVVSGIGKASSAAATSYLHLITGGSRDAVWLNVGIAGHGTRPVGETILAHKVSDHASGRAWYPPLVFTPPCATDLVTTVDRPEREMASAGAFEMEASGFVATAGRFASGELVHCLKVVSDGPSTRLESLTPRAARGLVKKSLPVIEAVAEACGGLSRELRRLDAEPSGLAECLDRWHFTVTEERELRRQLRRRRTLAPETPLPLDEVAVSARGKEVNRWLRAWLDELPVSLG